MNTETPSLSTDFMRLYCDESVYDPFSALHPISFRRVLPFQSDDDVLDVPALLRAEEAYLAGQNDATRRAVVEEYSRCGLLSKSEAGDLISVIDFFDADFFELMGMLYANKGMFCCALRWYRELIHFLETQNPNSRSDEESVYASVGYCLYSLGMFEEAIAWSKSCIGPRPVADAVFRALIHYESQPDGVVRGIERSGSRTRYTISVSAPDDERKSDLRLKGAMSEFAPFEEFYLDWVARETSEVELPPNANPFPDERDVGSPMRHKINFVFAACAHADELVANGFVREAKRLLSEAAMLAPQAEMVWERLRALP